MVSAQCPVVVRVSRLQIVDLLAAHRLTVYAVDIDEFSEAFAFAQQPLRGRQQPLARDLHSIRRWANRGDDKLFGAHAT